MPAYCAPLPGEHQHELRCARGDAPADAAGRVGIAQGGDGLGGVAGHDSAAEGVGLAADAQGVGHVGQRQFGVGFEMRRELLGGQRERGLERADSDSSWSPLRTARPAAAVPLRR